MDETKSSTIEMTADIVAAFVAQNTVAAEALPDLIRSIYGALSGIATGAFPASVVAEKLTPAVPIRRSITPEFLISLEDGKKYKSLKRHLRTKYDMSPEDYRAKWNLPKEYPMVAPNYAASRSALAKSMGLGRAAGQVAPQVKRAPRVAKPR